MDDLYQTGVKQWQTEAVVVGSRERVSVSQDNHLRSGSHNISFKSHVKSLGVYIDAALSLAKYFDHISRSAFIEIRRISSIRHLLTRKATVQLMCSFVLNRLNYWNSLLIDITSDQVYGLPQKIKTMQQKSFFAKVDMSVLNHFSKRFTGSQSKKRYFSR